MNIDLNIIGQLAPNADALKKGKELVQKGKYKDLHIDEDHTIIWAACAGSGKNPYYCSVDFINPNAPIARCNCPSRQFPCKHGIGIMLAYNEGHIFEVAAIPEDIIAKRQKIANKSEQKDKVQDAKTEKSSTTKKAPKTATIIKKVQQQLTGVELANKLLSQIVINGIGTIENSTLKTYEQQIKDLGNYYINGIQTAFSDLLLQIQQLDDSTTIQVVEKINYLSALLKRASTYLNEKSSNPTQEVDIQSEIEEQIGTIWKTNDLEQLGLIEENTTILQLAFFSYDDIARKEIVETGIWWSQQSHQIFVSKNYRPYKALKFVKEQNSIHGKLEIKALFINPGLHNQRIRWELGDQLFRNIAPTDLQELLNDAKSDFTPLIKNVKQQIKEPLMSKTPFYIIKFKDIKLLEGAVVVMDDKGEGIQLVDDTSMEINTIETFKMLLPSSFSQEIALLIYFKNDFESGTLNAVPLSLITQHQIIRLKY